MSKAPHKSEQLIQIRGFLYQTDDNRLVLAAEPNLRSCCIASQANISRQILIDSNHSLIIPSHQGMSILLEGNLIVEQAQNATYRYRIENARAINTAFNYAEITITLIGIIFITLYIIRRQTADKGSSRK